MVYSVIETINILSLYYYLINIVSIKIISLNFFSPKLQSCSYLYKHIWNNWAEEKTYKLNTASTHFLFIYKKWQYF